MILDLAEAFARLTPPPSQLDERHETFTAVPITSRPEHRLGIDRSGEPVVLLWTPRAASGPHMPDVTLANIRVQFDLECRVGHPDGAVELAHFTVVRCTGADRLLRAYFLRVAAVIVEQVGATPSKAVIGRAVDALVELFRAMDSPPRSSIQGLWAELLVATDSRRVAETVQAWHADPDGRFDFNAGNQRLEVKSSLARVRRHHFSLDQLAPIPGTDILVTSVFVERAGGGSGIGDLRTELSLRLQDRPDLVAAIDLQIARTLGDQWRQAQDERFDRQLAETSVRYYESRSIPTVGPEVPAGVSDVRFVADLSAISPMRPSELAQRGGLFAAILPLSPPSGATAR